MIGASKSDIETPALLIDLDLMDANIRKMSEYFTSKKSKLRAHVKTHKCPAIAHKQIKAGSRGICCQKLGEAEIMVDSGVKDVLITNEIVELKKIERLVRLNEYADVKVAVDDLRVAHNMAEIARSRNVKLGVVVEIDIRNKRCGTRPGKPTLELTKEICRMSGLEFRGLMAYEGPFLDVPAYDERKMRAPMLLRLLVETVEMIESEGISVEIVSGGSTGTYNITGEFPRISEVEAGSYVFMDSTYRRLDGLGFDCSLSVLSTVISRPISDRLIVDAGWKAATPEMGLPEVKGVEGAKLYHQSEEHGMIAVDPANRLQVGDKIELIPSHCCTTVNLHDSFYGIRNNIVEVVWPIAARGKSQ